MTYTDQFYALGTTINGGFRAEIGAVQALLADLRRKISAFEARFSRFRPDSELSWLNKNAGRPVMVSAAMIDILQSSRRIWQQTGGLIDPTVGQAVTAAGYDASFELLPANNSAKRQPFFPEEASLKNVEINLSRRTVTLPPRVRLDFGGLGKGYLLDLLVPMIEMVTVDYWFSLGGDLLVSGKNDEGQSWLTAVQDPLSQAEDLLRLLPPPGRWGMATSGTAKRHGVRQGTPWHHIIDPRTGLPAQTDVIASTVIAPTALDAEAIAKVILLRGSDQGLVWASEQDEVEALVITNDHQVISTPRMRKYTRPL